MKYLHIIDNNGEVKQVQFSPPNLPLFRLGTAPFHGDYVDIATQMFVPSNRGWTFNSAPSQSAVFHATWTDNRDVMPPGGNWWGEWTNYPEWPLTSEYSAPDSDYNTYRCTNALNTGMRNQNIYSARITSGIIAGSLGNTKPVDNIQHTFIVFVKNATSGIKSFRLTINAPNASFRQATPLYTLDIEIPPYSTVTRTVFVDPPQTQIGIDVVEIDEPDGSEIRDGITDYILLNPDPENPPVYDPLSDPNYPEVLYYEYHTPRVENPRVENYDLGAAGEMNPRVLNPRVENPRVLNPRVLNPRVENPRVLNPRVENINFLNPEMENPRVENPRVENTAMADVIWTVGNDGNTTSAYTLTMLSNAAVGGEIPDPDIIAQILVYKMHTTPVADGCTLFEEHQDQLLLNVINPRVENPSEWNPRVENPRVENPRVENPRVENASFALPPGEEAYVVFRIWDNNVSGNTAGVLDTANVAAGGLSIEDIIGTVDENQVPDAVGAALSAHSANTEDLEQPIPEYDPPVSMSANFSPEIGYSPSPLEFEAPVNGSDDSLDLSIWNSGEGILDYTLSIEYTSGDSWLTLNLNEGIHTAGDLTANQHVVTVHPAGLSADTYEAGIVIEAPGASNSPLRVPVTLTITSAATAPTVTTTAISGITSTEATSGGDVTSDGGASVTARGVCWSTSAGPTIAGSKTIDGAGTGAFASSKTGLNPGTTYYVRAYATNSVDTSYGSDVSFATTAVVTAPTVTTTAVSVTTSTAAMSGGNVTSDGGASVTARGVCWGTSADPTLTGNHSINGTGTGAFTSSITGLTPGTTYHVRAYATNSVDTSYGSDVSFNTNTISGLVAYYPFNGNANDQSGNGNNGTVNGAALTTDRFGNSNSAYEFNGSSDYIEAQDSATLDLTTDMTLAAWIYPASLPTHSSDYKNIFNKRMSVAGGYHFELFHGGAGYERIGFIVDDGTNIDILQASTSGIALNIWTHVVATLENNVMKIYINGTEVSSKSTTVIPSTNDLPLLIGVQQQPRLAYFDGKIDDMRIYNRALSATEIAQLSKPEFVTKWGSSGTGDGQFDHPEGVAVDSSGNVYVTDFDNHRIQKFNSSGTFLGWWGRDEINNTGWHNPGSGRIGVSGTGDGQFRHPRGIAVDSSGDVYVTEYPSDRVQKFTSIGGFITKWGSSGSGPGQFNVPEGIAVDSSGNVYVADTHNHRIQKFTSSGALIGWWGLDDFNNTGWHNPGSGRTGGVSGAGDGQFYNPWRVAVDSLGNVYVGDTANARVQKFTSIGTFITKWGTYGSGDGQFNYIRGLEVDISGNVYVTEAINQRIQKFR